MMDILQSFNHSYLTTEIRQPSDKGEGFEIRFYFYDSINDILIVNFNQTAGKNNFPSQIIDTWVTTDTLSVHTLYPPLKYF